MSIGGPQVGRGWDEDMESEGSEVTSLSSLSSSSSLSYLSSLNSNSTTHSKGTGIHALWDAMDDKDKDWEATKRYIHQHRAI